MRCAIGKENKFTPRFFTEEEIKIISERKDARFVIEMCIKNRGGGWANQPFAIFYSKEPHPVSNSRYFAFFYRDGQGYVTDGSSVDGLVFQAIEENGKFYHSVYRHDYYVTPGGHMIDGGRDYIRTDAFGKVVNMKIKNGRVFYEHE